MPIPFFCCSKNDTKKPAKLTKNKSNNNSNQQITNRDNALKENSNNKNTKNEKNTDMCYREDTKNNKEFEKLMPKINTINSLIKQIANKLLNQLEIISEIRKIQTTNSVEKEIASASILAALKNREKYQVDVFKELNEELSTIHDTYKKLKCNESANVNESNEDNKEQHQQIENDTTNAEKYSDKVSELLNELEEKEEIIQNQNITISVLRESIDKLKLINQSQKNNILQCNLVSRELNNPQSYTSNRNFNPEFSNCYSVNCLSGDYCKRTQANCKTCIQSFKETELQEKLSNVTFYSEPTYFGLKCLDINVTNHNKNNCVVCRVLDLSDASLVP